MSILIPTDLDLDLASVSSSLPISISSPHFPVLAADLASPRRLILHSSPSISPPHALALASSHHQPSDNCLSLGWSGPRSELFVFDESRVPSSYRRISQSQLSQMYPRSQTHFIHSINNNRQLRLRFRFTLVYPLAYSSLSLLDFIAD
ncbi:hypothetical protein CMV_004292 [Castanea mollissima]|uniref:Uncharacterized protein n=1 Tax=Castanea mollissima TaxID=60419 RepID=A0A8J4RM20_9ROSI|nr:hypothetical protein CMV_004292 [Castanea mollissima]